ncbi:MAG TPA: helix-hairpin-helix domain-containing protein [Verrucomicrobiae bacterium]|nr:helix-hairpin-helix domain-containing protein [Verrucomicrobiae bacterium]
MKKWKIALLLLVGALLSGCSQDPAKTRQQAADATAKLKPAIKQAGTELKKGAEEAGRQGKAIAQGAKQGWNSGSKVNVNTASKNQLMQLPGIDAEGAHSIIAGRPYHTREELKTRGVVSPEEYQKIAGMVVTR